MYIIEKANIEMEDVEMKTSLLIKNNKIYSMKDSYSRYHYTRMNLSEFIMTPTHVMLDFNAPPTNFQEMKEYFTKNFLLNGCSTIITPFTIAFESQFEEELRKKRTAMLNCPLDFIIGIKIPLHKLSVTLIRKCKRNKIPILFIELDHLDGIYEKPWGWIRESMFPYNPILVPIIKKEQSTLSKNLIKIWNEVLDKEKIKHVFEEIPKKTPISMQNLKKFGVYPKRGDLSIGSEINYNLYLKDDKVDESSGIHYHKGKLVIMVHKGQIVTSFDEVTYHPGYGEELCIQTTSLFI